MLTSIHLPPSKHDIKEDKMLQRYFTMNIVHLFNLSWILIKYSSEQGCSEVTFDKTTHHIWTTHFQGWGILDEDTAADTFKQHINIPPAAPKETLPNMNSNQSFSHFVCMSASTTVCPVGDWLEQYLLWFQFMESGGPGVYFRRVAQQTPS